MVRDLNRLYRAMPVLWKQDELLHPHSGGPPTRIPITTSCRSCVQVLPGPARLHLQPGPVLHRGPQGRPAHTGRRSGSAQHRRRRLRRRGKDQPRPHRARAPPRPGPPPLGPPDAPPTISDLATSRIVAPLATHSVVPRPENPALPFARQYEPRTANPRREGELTALLHWLEAAKVLCRQSTSAASQRQRLTGSVGLQMTSSRADTPSLEARRPYQGWIDRRWRKPPHPKR